MNTPPRRLNPISTVAHQDLQRPVSRKFLSLLLLVALVFGFLTPALTATAVEEVPPSDRAMSQINESDADPALDQTEEGSESEPESGQPAEAEDVSQQPESTQESEQVEPEEEIAPEETVPHSEQITPLSDELDDETASVILSIQTPAMPMTEFVPGNFVVTASEPVSGSYRWEIRDSAAAEWQTIAGISTASYNHAPTLAQNNAQIRVSLLNTGELVASSDPVTLTVQEYVVPSAFSATTVLSSGHTDVLYLIGKPGNLRQVLNDDTATPNVYRTPESVTLHVKPSVAIRNVGALLANNIGFTQGSQYYLLPQNNLPGQIFAGFGHNLPRGLWNQIQSIEYTIVDLEGPAGALFATWQNGDEGPEPFWQATVSQSSFTKPTFSNLAEHEHFNWGFSHLGEYRLSVQSKLTWKDGTVETPAAVHYDFIVAEELPTELQTQIAVSGLEVEYDDGASISLSTQVTPVLAPPVSNTRYEWQTRADAAADWVTDVDNTTASYAGTATVDGQQIRVNYLNASGTVLASSEPVTIVLAEEEPAPTPIPTDKVVLDHGHVDWFEVTYAEADNQLKLMVKDDTRIHSDDVAFRYPSDVQLLVADPETILTQVPAIPTYAFLGEFGSDFYLLPQVQNPVVPWPGWSTERLSSTLPAGVSLSSLELSVTVDGPGQVNSWQSGTFGSVINRYIQDSVGTIPIAMDAHVHTNWAFSELGTYTFSVTANATLTPQSGSPTQVSSVTEEFVIHIGEPEEDPGEEPGGDDGLATGQAILTQGHADTLYLWGSKEHLRLVVRDDTISDAISFRKPEDVIFHVLPVTEGNNPNVRTASANLAAALPGFVSAGEEYYLLPQTNVAGQLFLGFGHQWQANQFNSISYTVKSVSGPGEFATWQSTEDGFKPFWNPANNQLTFQNTANHEHIAWGFTKPGTYQITVGVVAEWSADGAIEVLDDVVYSFVIGEEDTTDPGSPVPPPALDITGLRSSYAHGAEVILTAQPRAVVSFTQYRWETRASSAGPWQPVAGMGGNVLNTTAENNGQQFRVHLLDDNGVVISTSQPVTLSVTSSPPSPPPSQRVTLSRGHIDLFEVTYTNGRLQLLVKDDTRLYSPNIVFRNPSDVTVSVNPRQAQMLVPDNPELSFLGAAGSVIYLLPQTQNSQLPWPGWSTERLTATLPSGVSASSVSLQVQASGPGQVHLWQTGSIGNVVNHYVTGTSGSIPVSVPAHVHSNWSFSAQGTYTVTVTASATLSNGQRVSSPAARYVFQVGSAGVVVTPDEVRAALAEQADSDELLGEDELLDESAGNVYRLPNDQNTPGGVASPDIAEGQPEEASSAALWLAIVLGSLVVFGGAGAGILGVRSRRSAG